jgi:hypothetical protein
MSKSSVLSKAVRVDPEVEDRQTAARISDAGLAGGSGQTSIRFPDGTVVPLSASLLKVLQASAEELADGHAVTVMSSEVALTPAEAADLLGLSRPFVVRLLDDGSIPSQLLPQSRHRKGVVERRDRVSGATCEEACRAPADLGDCGRERSSVLIGPVAICGNKSRATPCGVALDSFTELVACKQRRLERSSEPYRKQFFVLSLPVAIRYGPNVE